MQLNRQRRRLGDRLAQAHGQRRQHGGLLHIARLQPVEPPDRGIGELVEQDLVEAETRALGAQIREVLLRLRLVRVEPAHGVVVVPEPAVLTAQSRLVAPRLGIGVVGERGDARDRPAVALQERAEVFKRALIADSDILPAVHGRLIGDRAVAELHVDDERVRMLREHRLRIAAQGVFGQQLRVQLGQLRALRLLAHDDDVVRHRSAAVVLILAERQLPVGIAVFVIDHIPVLQQEKRSRRHQNNAEHNRQHLLPGGAASAVAVVSSCPHRVPPFHVAACLWINDGWVRARSRRAGRRGARGGRPQTRCSGTSRRCAWPDSDP